MSEKRFVGPYEVKNLVKSEDSNMVHVYVEGKEYPLIMPEIVYMGVVGEKCDLTELRDKKLHPVMLEIVEILLKYDVKFNEIDNLFLIITNFLNEKLDYASARLWHGNVANKPEDGYVPGEVFENRTVNDINNFLMSDERENTSENGDKDNKPSSEGTGSDTSDSQI